MASSHSMRTAKAVRIFAVSLMASTAVLAISGPLVSTQVMAQETSARLTGIVVDAKGLSAEGANLEITHVPSGTTAHATTNEAGRFDVQGLRVGGPYTIKVTGDGLKEIVLKDQFLQLGSPKQLTIQVAGKAAPSSVETVEVVGTRRDFKTGTAADFSREKIATVATVSRDLKDIVRNDPNASVVVNNGVPVVYIAGSNNRFNSLTVDGIRQNDDFGLNGNGYPTQRSPISLEWVEQMSVLTAPFDVLYSGFQGGTINITTKSGGNDFHGSGFGYVSARSFAGNYNPTTQAKFQQLSDNQTAGGTFSGPIIKDKLFFFAGWERYDGTAAGPTIVNTTISADQFNAVANQAQTKFGYDVGGLSKAVNEYQTNLLLKLDYNINAQHRLSSQYQESKGSVINPSGNGLTSFGTTSDWYNNNQEQFTYSTQLFSEWTSKFSTEIKYGDKYVRTLPTPLGGYGIGQVTVNTLPAATGNGTIIFGPDISRQANLLHTNTKQYLAKGTYILDNHSVSAGWERESVDVFNVFVQRTLGDFSYNSLSDFLANNALALTYQNALTGNASDAAAIFGYDKDSFFLQDRWTVSDNLTIQGGLRYERFSTGDKPALNPYYVTRYGFDNTHTLDGKDVILPRIGFNWKALENTTVRGGAGLFSGTGPGVWISNSFANTGVLSNSTCIFNSKLNTAARQPSGCTDVANNPALLSILNNANPKQIPASLLALLSNPAQLAVAPTASADPNLKLPTNWRFSATVEQNFDVPYVGKDFTFAVDAIYNKVQEAFVYKDLRLVRSGTAWDGRPIYSRSGGGSNGDIFLTNTTQGDGTIVSASLKKQWDTPIGDISAFASYTHQNINDVNPLTSSVANSNYTGIGVTDPNNPGKARSNYEIEHDFKMSFDWGKDVISGYRSYISIFGDRRSGIPFSFGFNGNVTGTTVLDPGSSSRQLFYVPKDANDVILTGGLTWAQVDGFIRANGLDKYRGQVAPRNAFTNRFVDTLDLRLAQEVPGLFSGHKGTASIDFKNFLNLINNKWGRDDELGGFPNNGVVAAGVDPATGKYVYSPASGTTRSANNIFIARNTTNAFRDASVWRIQVGLKYDF